METIEERRQNFADALDHKQPKKIPVEIEVTGWPLAYGGMTLTEALADPIKGAEAFCRYMDDVPYDLHAMDAGYMWAPPIYNMLGSDLYTMGSDGVFPVHNQIGTEFASAEDYDELIHNYPAYMFDRRVRKLYSIYDLPREEAYEKLKAAAVATKKFRLFNAEIARRLEEKGRFQAVAMFAGGPMYRSPLSQICDEIRGLKETLIDLRRRPGKVDELISVLETMPMPLNPHWADGLPYKIGMTIYHIECFLNRKQFEKYFWEPFTRQYRPMMEQGVKFLLKGEGAFLNTIDCYNDLPDHSMLFMLEQDDPFEAYKIIGEKHSLIAGAPLELLQCGSKDECVAYAKKCFDTFAPGGGFVFGNNKPLLGAKDAKTENIIAVYRFADEYSRQ